MEETLLEYVKRKLVDSDIPLTVVAKKNKIARNTLYRVIANEDVGHSKIQKLYDYYKKLAD
jgi:predicted transcriptional regulator